jgi:hypothetical protein
MLPGKQGPGSLQPMVRYQQLKQDEIDAKRSTIDAGLNYIIDGHNARATLNYQYIKNELGPLESDVETVLLGGQVQF